MFNFIQSFIDCLRIQCTNPPSLFDQESQQIELSQSLSEVHLEPQKMHDISDPRSHNISEMNPFTKNFQESPCQIETNLQEFLEEKDDIFSVSFNNDDEIRSVQNVMELQQPQTIDFTTVLIEKEPSQASTDHQDSSMNSSPIASEDSFTLNQTDPIEKVKKNLIHLRNSRRKKGRRNYLQRKVNGYETKNLLIFASRVHKDFIEKMKEGFLQLEENQELLSILSKKHITMAEYVILYKVQELKTVWDRFFRTQHLYREVMLSKVNPDQKQIYIKYLSNFQVAYVTKQFTCLTRVPSVVPEIKYHSDSQ